MNNHIYLRLYLNRVPEVRISLKHNFAPISPFVLPSENDGVDNDDQHDQDVGRNAGSDTGMIVRRVLSSEDGATSDTANTAEPDKRRGCESSLPLTSDVVGLVRHDGGNPTVAAGADEEDAEEANSSTGSPSL